jgi:hypothetical protein
LEKGPSKLAGDIAQESPVLVESLQKQEESRAATGK